MRRFLVIAGLLLTLLGVSKAQVIGLEPYPQAMYYWNTNTKQWTPCPNTSTDQPSQNLPQPFAQFGFNSGLGQWTPFTGCPGTAPTGLESFTSGPLFPLFTTSLGSDPLLNPALTFTLDSTPTFTVLGNFQATTAPWDQWALAAGTNITLDPNTGTKTLTFNVGATSPSLDVAVDPPTTGQFAVVYPTGGLITSDPPALSNIYGTSTPPGTVAGGHFQWQCSGLLCSIAGNVSAHWTNFELPSYIDPATVTAVYADAVTTAGPVNPLWAYTDSFSGTTLSCNGQELMLSPTLFPYSGTEVSKLTSLTGATFNSSAACLIQVGGSGPGNTGQYVDVAAVRFLVFYSGPAPPANPALHIRSPLNFNAVDNTLFLDESNLPAGYLQGINVAFLPTPALFPWALRYVLGTSDCATASSDTSLCYSDGTSWHLFAGGGGGGGDTITSPGSTLTVGGTSTATTLDLNLAHANAWTALQGFGAGVNLSGTAAPLELNGSAGTIGQCPISQGPGVTPSWGSCGTGSGIGGSGTPGVLPEWTASTTQGNSPIDDGNTHAGAVTIGKKTYINDPSDPTSLTLPYNVSLFSGTAGAVAIGPDSSGNGMMSENGGTPARLCDATNGVCTASAVNVNGSPVSNPNFGNLPAAGSNGRLVTWQVGSSNVSAEIVGDGNAAHYLDGTGNYTTPAGGGGGSGTTLNLAAVAAQPTPASTTFLQAVNNAANQPVSVLVAGDSFTIADQTVCGTSCGPVVSANRWAEQIRIQLQAIYGSHGTGIVPIVFDFTGTINSEAYSKTGTTDLATSALGPSRIGAHTGNSLLHLATGATITFNDSRSIKWDTLHVYGATSAGSGSLVCPSPFGTLTTGSASATGAVSGGFTATRWDLTATTLATHSVTCTASGDFYLYAFQGTAGTTGAEVSIIGLGGANAYAFGNAPTTQLAFTDLDFSSQHAFVFMDLTNDVAESTPTSTFQTQIQSIITHEQALSAAPVVMLAIPGVDIAATGSAGPYTAVQTGLCTTNQLTCVNIQDRGTVVGSTTVGWGTTYNSASGLWDLTGITPGIHPNDKGNLDEFQMIFAQLVNPTATGAGKLNGTITYTSSQTASASDAGKLVVMNCSSACVYTLPTTQPSGLWSIWLKSVGSSVATVALSGGDTYNGTASVPVLNPFRETHIWANTATATDYQGEAPITVSSPIVSTPSSNGFNIACPTCSIGNLKLQDTALDAIPGSPTTWDDEFTGEASLPVKWTQSIGSGCSQSYLNSQQLYLVCGGSASEVPSYIHQAPPGSGTWTFTVKLKLIGGMETTKILGLYLGDGSNVLDMKVYNNTNTYSYQVCGSNSPATSTCLTNFAQGALPTFFPATGWIYLQVAYDGTHYTWNYSFNGINFTQAFQGTSGAFLGSLTQVGIFWSNIGTSGSMNGYSYWFRRTN